jgi:drug/metabolite transporter (DMT)-like permease
MSPPSLPLPQDPRFVRGLAFAFIGAIAFSGKAILAKLLYRYGVDAFAVVGLRMAMALPLFAIMVWWSGRADHTGATPAPLTTRERWTVAGLGFSGYFLASTLDFMGLQYISASLERAILYLNPTIVLILSAVFLGQRVQWRQLVAMAVSYSGVVIVLLHDWDAASRATTTTHGLSAMQAMSLGSVLVLLSAASYAVYMMVSGQLVQRLGSARLVGLASCAACLMCLAQWGAVYLLSDGQSGSVAHLPWQAWALSALNSVACTVLPIWLLMRGVALLGASTASQIGMVGPVSTIWMASLWLDEPVTGRLLLGTTTVLLGIVLLSRWARRTEAEGDVVGIRSPTGPSVQST